MTLFQRRAAGFSSLIHLGVFGSKLAAIGRASQGRICLQMSGKNEDEEGRISLLILGFAVVVVALILVAVTVTSIHVQNKRLRSLADSLVLISSSYPNAQGYFAGHSDAPAEQVCAQAHLAVRKLPSQLHAQFHNLRIVECAVPRAGLSQIRVQADGVIPFVPDFIDVPALVTLEVTATAFSRSG